MKSVNVRQLEKQILDKVLGPKVYDRRIRPGGSNTTAGMQFTSSFYLLVIMHLYSILMSKLMLNYNNTSQSNYLKLTLQL